MFIVLTRTSYGSVILDVMTLALFLYFDLGSCKRCCIIEIMDAWDYLRIVYNTKKTIEGSTPSSMISIIQHLLQEPRSKYKKRAKVITSNMTDPYDVLVKTINTLF